MVCLHCRLAPSLVLKKREREKIIVNISFWSRLEEKQVTFGLLIMKKKKRRRKKYFLKRNFFKLFLFGFVWYLKQTYI